MLKYLCDINLIFLGETIHWQKCIVFAFIFPKEYLCKFVSQQSGMSILYAVPFWAALFFYQRSIKMKNKTFDSNIEKIYSELTDEQKAEYKHKEENFNKVFLAIGIIFCPIVIGVLILCLVLCIPDKMYGILAYAIIVVVILAAIVYWIFLTSLRELKANDEIKIKTRIERLEKQKTYKLEQEKKQRQQALFKNVHYRLDFDNIARVTILDSYTEMSDKLHAILNYQEIIQTRVYKFKVDYKDGTTNIVTAAENSEEYNALIPLVNKNTDTQTPIKQEKSNIEKIREYKQLLDDGIITQEEFEEKKKELL